MSQGADCETDREWSWWFVLWCAVLQFFRVARDHNKRMTSTNPMPGEEGVNISIRKVYVSVSDSGLQKPNTTTAVPHRRPERVQT